MRPAFHAAWAAFSPRTVRAVEVGVEEGLNAEVVMREWCEPGQVGLTLVEIDPAREPAIRERLKAWSYAINLIIDDSVEAARRFPDETFDLVYLDDDHRYSGITRSLAAWEPKAKRGGIIGGHDFMQREDDEVRKAVTEFVERRGWPLFTAEWDWWTVRG